MRRRRRTVGGRRGWAVVVHRPAMDGPGFRGGRVPRPTAQVMRADLSEGIRGEGRQENERHQGAHPPSGLSESCHHAVSLFVLVRSEAA